MKSTLLTKQHRNLHIIAFACLIVLTLAGERLLGKPAGQAQGGSADTNSTSNASGTNDTKAAASSQITNNTDSSFSLGANLLSYESQARIAAEIVTQIKYSTRLLGISKVYITSDLLNAGGEMFLYQATLNQLSQLSAAYDAAIAAHEGRLTVESTSGIPWLDAASQAMTIVKDLGDLLRTGVSISGLTMPIGDLGLIGPLAQQLKKNNIDAIYPSIYSNTEYVNDTNSILSQLNKNAAFRAKAQAIIDSILPPSEGTKSSNSTDSVTFTSPVQDKRFTTLDKSKQRTALTLSSLNNVYDDLVKSLSQNNTLRGFMLADFYTRALAEKPGSYLLFVKILYAGGANRTKSNPFFDLFRDGPRLSHIGGAVVVYALMGKQGEIILSGTLNDYVGYKAFEDSGGTIRRLN